MAKKKPGDSAGPSSDVDAIDFEDALAQVEQIVAKLETGDLGLTDSLGQYEVGVRRLKQCHAMLASAEQRVSVLAGFDADGNPVTQPLDEMQVRGGPSGSKSGEKTAAKTTRSRKPAASSPDGDENSRNDDSIDGGVDAGAELF